MTVVTIGGLVLIGLAVGFVLACVALVFWLLWKLFKGVFWSLGHLFRGLGFLIARLARFLKREVVDTVHTAGAVVTAATMLPLVIVNGLIFRWRAAGNYARAAGDELANAAIGVARVALGNPLWLVGLGDFFVAQRRPVMYARTPRAWRATRPSFDGYEVTGSLPAGGSGAQLYVARPKASTLKRYVAAGRPIADEVVIKSFALQAGSTLPEIVRESRALDAASRLGLVYEHHLTGERFYYVMPYVRGEELDRAVRALHVRAGSEGLGERELMLVLGYAIDVLDTLERFHQGGLWHKDVKPANVIVERGRAHLVDFGLVTPLASAMTLTTHGTEYYRDPEMVRLALQGVKVHEVDGVKFDVYSAGAVLYSMIEDSFPAHGSLSKIDKRCPEALRWIVQRAMADLRARYGSAREMRADLAALASASDPFALRPADLPSFRSLAGETVEAPRAADAASPFPPRPTPVVAAAEAELAASSFRRPRRRRHHGARVLAGLTAGTLLVAMGSAFFANGRRVAAQRYAAVEDDSLGAFSAEDRALLELARDLVEELGDGAETDASALESAAREAEAELRGESSRELERQSSIMGAALRHVREHVAPTVVRTSELRLPGATGRVLVLEDLHSSVDSRALLVLKKLLGLRGFAVVGEDAEDGADPQGIELTAQAHRAVGLGSPADPESELALQRFLDARNDLDAIVWVSRSAEEDVHVYRVLLRRD